MSSRKLKLSTARNILVFMTDSADHISGKTGLTLTVTESKAAGAFSAMTVTVTERSNGFYQLALTTTHTNTLGDYALHITATGADPTDILMEVVAYDPADSVRLGLTALPNAAATSIGGLPTVRSGSTSNDIGISDFGIVKSNVLQWSGQDVVVPTITGVPKVDIERWKSGVIPAPSVTGVPIVDAQYWLGVAAPDIKRSLGLMHENAVVDNQVYGAFGLTSARIRVFANAAAALAAVKGAADNANGETQRYTITSAYSINGLDDYRLVRQL